MILEEFPKETPAADSAVVPVGVKVLADAETPVSVLARFDRREKNLFLLESAEGGERRGRYSFLGLDADSLDLLQQLAIRGCFLDKALRFLY